MSQDEKTIRERLKGRRVLIIEDDKDLAPRLGDVFKSWGVKATDIRYRRCVRGSDHGALDFLCSEADSLDLICVDIMLPWDEEALKTCDNRQHKWNELQEKVTKLRDRGPIADQDVNDMRSKLSVLSGQIRATIDRKAGVKMIIEWCKEMRKRSGKDWTPRAAILFLTARFEASLATEISEVKKYLSEFPKVKWITKPALELQVVTAAAELLT